MVPEAGCPFDKKEQLNKIFVYKLKTDNGGAPCIFRNMLSLAICKPKIRKIAEDADIIFGFGGKHYGEHLIYIAVVKERTKIGDYYRNHKFALRPDCIYRDKQGIPKLKANARYHTQSDEREHDVGLHFERSYVLLSKDFRYFGRAGTDSYKKDSPRVKAIVEHFGRNHRSKFTKGEISALLALKKAIWRRFRRKQNGPPTDRDTTRPCNRDALVRYGSCDELAVKIH